MADLSDNAAGCEFLPCPYVSPQPHQAKQQSCRLGICWVFCKSCGLIQRQGKHLYALTCIPAPAVACETTNNLQGHSSCKLSSMSSPQVETNPHKRNTTACHQSTGNTQAQDMSSAQTHMLCLQTAPCPTSFFRHLLSRADVGCW